jgi:hypothetical protein
VFLSPAKRLNFFVLKSSLREQFCRILWPVGRFHQLPQRSTKRLNFFVFLKNSLWEQFCRILWPNRVFLSPANVLRSVSTFLFLKKDSLREQFCRIWDKFPLGSPLIFCCLKAYLTAQCGDSVSVLSRLVKSEWHRHSLLPNLVLRGNALRFPAGQGGLPENWKDSQPQDPLKFRTQA